MFDLLYAAAVGDLPSVQHCILRSQKANFLWGDLTRTCGRGRAAQHYAVLGGHTSVVRELIRAGAQVNWQDKDGTTCLMIAAERGSELVIELLIGGGADVHMVARDGSTAAHFAARSGKMECLKRLLKAGSSVIAADCLGRMLIHWAAQNGNTVMAGMLLEQGCPVHGGTSHVTGNTPLHIAVKHGHVDMVKLLLLHRAAVNAVTKDGQTPLHVCCSSTLAPPSALHRIGAILLSEKRVHIQALDSYGKPAQFYTKDTTMKNMINSAIQGKAPTSCEPRQLHNEEEVTQSRAAIKPIVVHPHPVIPGHKWAISDEHSQKTDSAQEPRGESVQLSAVCPFAIDLTHCGHHAMDFRQKQLMHEELIWKASQTQCKNVKHGSRDSRLIPSDRMWFDSGSQRILTTFPARQYLGRYRS